jgi:uncharacterized damage-inducible protein DinB
MIARCLSRYGRRCGYAYDHQPVSTACRLQSLGQRPPVCSRARFIESGLSSSHRVLFGSLHGTLNHLLLTDRLWLKRLTGEGDHPNQLNAILYDDRVELARARIAEDDRLIAVVERYDEAALASLHSYKTTSGMPQSQVLSDILLHLFNHQTHHRGQAHACLSILTGGEPPSLDLLVFQRGGTAPKLETLTLMKTFRR